MVIGDKTKKGEMLLKTIERLDLKSLTYAERLQYMKEGEERRKLYGSRYQLNKMIDDAKRLLLRYGVRPGRVDISDYTPVDDFSNDAVKVVEHSRQALDCIEKNNIEDAVYYSMLWTSQGLLDAS